MLDDPAALALRCRPDEAVFHAESVDSRPNVNCLAAAMGTWNPALFFMHILSMRNHFGMRIVKNWLDNSFSSVEELASSIDPDRSWSYHDLEKLRNDFIESTLSDFVWSRKKVL